MERDLERELGGSGRQERGMIRRIPLLPWRSHSCTSNTVGLDDDDEDEGGSGVDDS